MCHCLQEQKGAPLLQTDLVRGDQVDRLGPLDILITCRRGRRSPEIILKMMD